jgi:hypothetical protein
MENDEWTECPYRGKPGHHITGIRSGRTGCNRVRFKRTGQKLTLIGDSGLYQLRGLPDGMRKVAKSAGKQHCIMQGSRLMNKIKSKQAGRHTLYPATAADAKRRTAIRLSRMIRFLSQLRIFYNGVILGFPLVIAWKTRQQQEIKREYVPQ